MGYRHGTRDMSLPATSTAQESTQALRSSSSGIIAMLYHRIWPFPQERDMGYVMVCRHMGYPATPWAVAHTASSSGIDGREGYALHPIGSYILP